MTLLLVVALSAAISICGERKNACQAEAQARAVQAGGRAQCASAKSWSTHGSSCACAVARSATTMNRARYNIVSAWSAALVRFCETPRGGRAITANVIGVVATASVIDAL